MQVDYANQDIQFPDREVYSIENVDVSSVMNYSHQLDLSSWNTIVGEVKGLYGLSHNWDGDDSYKPAQHAISFLLRLLHELQKTGCFAPSYIDVSGNGEVSICWETNQIVVEFTVGYTDARLTYIQKQLGRSWTRSLDSRNLHELRTMSSVVQKITGLLDEA